MTVGYFRVRHHCCTIFVALRHYQFVSASRCTAPVAPTWTRPPVHMSPEAAAQILSRNNDFARCLISIATWSDFDIIVDESLCIQVLEQSRSGFIEIQVHVPTDMNHNIFYSIQSQPALKGNSFSLWQAGSINGLNWIDLLFDLLQGSPSWLSFDNFTSCRPMSWSDAPPWCVTSNCNVEASQHTEYMRANSAVPLLVTLKPGARLLTEEKSKAYMI